MPTIIELMYDNSVVVRDTAAWTIGRICEINPESAINEHYLGALLEAMVNGLKAEPRVASNVCWAFTGLAEASYEAASAQEGTDQPSTYCLSQYFDLLVENLLETTNRPDGSQVNYLLQVIPNFVLYRLMHNSVSRLTCGQLPMRR